MAGAVQVKTHRIALFAIGLFFAAAVCWAAFRHGSRMSSHGGVARSLMRGSQSPESIYSYDFTWTIYITPAPFVDTNGRVQRRAIESWLRLTPKPRIIMLGQGEGYADVAAEYQLTVDPHLDLNFVMMPLAGSLLDRANGDGSDITVILNSDIILTQSFVDALAKMRSHFTDWFLTGARYDIDELPPVYEPSREDFHEPAFINYVKTKGLLHTAGGADYFAWNNSPKKLIQGIMPPFIRGKSKFDNWIVHEVIAAGFRDVVDGTEAVTAVHVVHNYKTADGQVNKVDGKDGSTFWQKAKANNWMIFHNIHLAIHYGTYRNQDGTTVHTPWKLSACMEPGGMCLIKRLRPGICPCEHNAFAINTQNDPQVVSVFENDVRKNVVKCASVTVDRDDAYKIPVVTSENHPPVYGLPFTLKDLLPLVARNNHVILTGVSYAYRDVLMNFICNLRRLGIYDSLIVAAFDEETYRFGFKMGIPVFFYQSEAMKGLSPRDMVYGSEGFKSVTKLKSQMVLQILRMGYDVTWTDTDIVWFRDPMPLLSGMKSDFVVQSNAPWPQEQAANGPLRINSGFYRVRSTPGTIAAMESIVAHAATSKLTEQPSFYIILCGGKEGTNTAGPNKCIYTPDANHLNRANKPMGGDDNTANLEEEPLNGGAAAAAAAAAAKAANANANGNSEMLVDPVEVEFLDRTLFPNGAVGGYWDAEDVLAAQPNLVILHNNWIRGLRSKVKRAIDHKLWFYSRDKEICDYSARPKFSLDWAIDEKEEE
eukprot:m.81418 g.81418  ORF g.81418 m.81418 type:complete len:764 (-) comp14876_c0_seq3:854-3145(-)